MAVVYCISVKSSGQGQQRLSDPVVEFSALSIGLGSQGTVGCGSFPGLALLAPALFLCLLRLPFSASTRRRGPLAAFPNGREHTREKLPRHGHRPPPLSPHLTLHPIDDAPPTSIGSPHSPRDLACSLSSTPLPKKGTPKVGYPLPDVSRAAARLQRHTGRWRRRKSRRLCPLSLSPAGWRPGARRSRVRASARREMSARSTG